jgi:hypothetical protein
MMSDPQTFKHEIKQQEIPECNFSLRKPMFYVPKEGLENKKNLKQNELVKVDRPLEEHEIPFTDDQIKSVNWTKLMTSLIFTKCLRYAASASLATGTITGAYSFLKHKNRLRTFDWFIYPFVVVFIGTWVTCRIVTKRQREMIKEAIEAQNAGK